MLWHKARKDLYLVSASTLAVHKITAIDFQSMLLIQDMKCAICARNFFDLPFVQKTHQKELKPNINIDHDHRTNLVRGLLCDECNKGLGFMKDNIGRLQAAISYLKKHLKKNNQ